MNRIFIWNGLAAVWFLIAWAKWEWTGLVLSFAAYAAILVVLDILGDHHAPGND